MTHGDPAPPAGVSVVVGSWPAPARDSATLPERALPSLLLAAAATLFWLAPELKATAAPIPFLVALLFLGLPHGAADGTLLMRSAGRGRALAIALGYLLVMAFAAAALFLWPVPTLIAFLVLAGLHFGSADAEETFGPTVSVARSAWALGRGGLIIGLPFLADAERAWAPFARLAQLESGEAVAAASSSVGPLAAAIAIASLAGLFGSFLASRWHIARRPNLLDLTECALIGAVALIADPLFAVGAYFVFVHGFKQSAAVGRELGDGAGLASRLFSTHRASLPLLIPSWVVLAAGAWLVGVDSAFDLAALSLGLYVVATPPHELLQHLLPGTATQQSRR